MLGVSLKVIVLLVASGTLLGFFGRWNWLFDILSHFRVQYLLILITSGIILALGGQISTGLIAFTFGLVNLYTIAPLFIREERSRNQENSYRFLQANILQINQSYSKVMELIHTFEPDFILLIETNHRWDRALDEIRSLYPYENVALREDNYGLSLFSRIPFAEAEVITIGEKPLPTLVVKLQLDGAYLTMIGTHPPPPKGKQNANFRNMHLKELSSFVRSIEGKVILCGDLNITRWSPFFQEFLKESDLKDSAMGFGYQPTWPTDLPIFLIPIDHCLVSTGISVINRRIGPKIGSDHYPIIFEFSEKERQEAKEGQNAHSHIRI